MLNSVKLAIVEAHKNNNAHAINKSDCEKLGIPEQNLDQWIAYVSKLRAAVVAYIPKSQDGEATDKELNALEGAIFAAWQDVCKQGADDSYIRKFFVRKKDVVHLVGLCGERFMNTAVGKRIANHTATEFRRNIESLIGVRMVMEGYLDDEKSAIIEGYEGACKSIKSLTEQIDGYKRGKEQVPGLKSKLTAVKAILLKKQEFADKFKFEDDARKEFLAEYEDAVLNTTQALSDAQSKLDAAIKKRDSLQKKYDGVIATLHTIDESF